MELHMSLPRAFERLVPDSAVCLSDLELCCFGEFHLFGLERVALRPGFVSNALGLKSERRCGTAVELNSAVRFCG